MFRALDQVLLHHIVAQGWHCRASVLLQMQREAQPFVEVLANYIGGIA
ncbi:MAG TPA: hypothetical protein VNE63_02605 [Candidatus Acidoferrales bacterium]|nr:hypothetical protein [Candidatus Acidoferrales bacterium]